MDCIEVLSPDTLRDDINILMLTLKQAEKKIRKMRRQSHLTDGDKRLIALISTVIVTLCIGVGFYIASRPGITVTDTGRFVITEEGNSTEKVTITIEGIVPDGYILRTDIPDESYFTFTEVSTSEDKAENKSVFELTPIKKGAAILDFYYETVDGSSLYTKLHYTVEIYSTDILRLLTVNVTD